MRKRCINALVVLALLLPWLALPAAPAMADSNVEPLAPAAGDIFYTGDLTDIMWMNGPLTTKVSISYSTDNGVTYTDIQNDITATANSAQSIGWLVPSADSDKCVIKFHYKWFFMGSTNEGDAYSEAFTIKSYHSPQNLVATADSPSSIQLTWEDNGTDEDCYRVNRRIAVTGTWEVIQWNLPANTESFKDTGLEADTTYEYKVEGIKFDAANQAHYDGDPTNIASATTLALVLQVAKPNAPSSLTALATDDEKIDLEWTDNSADEINFKIYRQEGSNGTMDLLETVGAGVEEYTDSDVEAGKTYYYQVCASNTAGDSALSNVASATVGQSPQAALYVLKYYIGNLQYLVNGQAALMDAMPAVIENRILLPIRFVVDPLGGTPLWDDNTKQATITCNGHVLILWLNNNTATLDGAAKQIDPDNAAVTPISINGRIFVPLRFVGESLDCDVVWNQGPQEAVITYPDPTP